MPEHNSQYLIRITAEQFKNVKVIDFMPNRYLTTVSGPNGAGKTSALDAVFHALASRKTLSPSLIRQGQKKGYLRIETNTHIITRHLDEKGGSLQIEAKASNTLVKAPDDWLEGIAGDLGFDPLKFMRLKPEEQFEVLKALVPLEADIDDLEARNEADEESMTKKRAEAKRLEAARDQVVIDKSLPTEPVNIDELLKQAREASEFNAGIEREAQRRKAELNEMEIIARAMNSRAERMDELKAEMLRLENLNAADKKQLDDRTAVVKALEPLAEPRDRSAIDTRISEASGSNARITTNNANKAQRERFEKDVDTIKAELETLQEEVRKRKITIASTLSKAKFPVAGLSFETIVEGSGGRERKNPKKIITYHGVPLADASTAEQIRVSTAIGMANKPELRFLLIREGSLLDDNGLAILEQMAHEQDFQILMEKVDTSGKVGIFMEDGTIKAVNAEPEAKPEAAKKPTRSKKNKEQGELIQ